MLLALHQPRSHTEIIDVRFQRISEFLIIGSVDGNVLADISFGDGAEVDSGNRTIGQHTLEIPDAFMMVVEAFQLKRMVTRSVTLWVPTRVCPYKLPGSKARHIIRNC